MLVDDYAAMQDRMTVRAALMELAYSATAQKETAIQELRVVSRMDMLPMVVVRLSLTNCCGIAELARMLELVKRTRPVAGKMELRTSLAKS